MGVLAIMCVKSVARTSLQLCSLFDWKSTHGGDHFDELIDRDGNKMIWLHDMNSHEHARFRDVNRGKLGRGIVFYVFVHKLDEIFKRTRHKRLKIVEEIELNESAGFREFTFLEDNGYQFTVAEL